MCPARFASSFVIDTRIERLALGLTISTALRIISFRKMGSETGIGFHCELIARGVRETAVNSGVGQIVR
jgi:hypothetical protein